MEQRAALKYRGSGTAAGGTALETVWRCGVFLEGPAAAPDGSIYFTDVTGSHNYAGRPSEMRGGVIRRFDPKTGTTTVHQSPSGNATGIDFGPDGNELGRISLPEGAANLEFGRGEESDVLYIAGRTAPSRVNVKTRGWHQGER